MKSVTQVDIDKLALTHRGMDTFIIHSNVHSVQAHPDVYDLRLNSGARQEHCVV
jgi:hypothetical protein